MADAVDCAFRSPGNAFAMSLQGPILIVADKPTGELAQAFTDAGAFPIVEASWAGAPTAAAEIKPSAIVLSEPDDADRARRPRSPATPPRPCLSSPCSSACARTCLPRCPRRWRSPMTRRPNN